MAHCIEERDRQFGVEMGWHKLTQIRETLERDECFPEIVGRPLYYEKDGEYKQCEEWNTPICLDDNLPVGNGEPFQKTSYEMITPRELWDFAKDALEGSGHRFISTVTVCNRSRFAITVSLDELKQYSIGDRQFQDNLNILGSFGGKSNIEMKQTNVCVVCKNTIDACLATSSKLNIKIRHNKGAKQRLFEAQRLIEESLGVQAILRKVFESLAEKPCNQQEAEKVYTGYLVGERKVDEIGRNGISRITNETEELVDLFARGKGNRGENRLDLLMGLTDRYSHGSRESKKNTFSIIDSSEFGQWNNRKAEFARGIQNEESYNRMKKVGEEFLLVN